MKTIDICAKNALIGLAAVMLFAVGSASAQSPVTYNFQTGGPTFTQGCPSCYFIGETVSGSFVYDHETPLTTVVGGGFHIYIQSMTDWNGDVGADTFNDEIGLAVVGNDIIGGTRDLFTLRPGINLNGFVRNDFELVDIRMMWIEEAPGIPTGVPDFLDNNMLPVEPPAIPGTLWLDFENPLYPEVTFTMSFENLVVTRAPSEVAIDIKPGTTPNSINPASKQHVAVAILSTDEFDATQVDPSSVVFGPAAVSEAHGMGHIKDIDEDGDADLLLHFIAADSGIACGDTDVSITGETFGGEEIAGTDSINTVNCGR